MQLFDDEVQDLSPAKWWIQLDLYSGYHQIKVHENSKAKLAFFAPDGWKYRYIQMPLGPTNAPSAL